METPETVNSSNSESGETVSTLSDLMVKYDMSKLVEEAQTEFEAVITSRELIDQDSIGNFFNIDQN